MPQGVPARAEPAAAPARTQPAVEAGAAQPQGGGAQESVRVSGTPVPVCVHHDPSRALGDLTGLKKHFCRKHGEKKWKCDKCSKRYAVQSDWKAHSKICGTREYRCDCGTLFSRRDSFITHRAFCDALAEESARAVTAAAAVAGQHPGLLFSHGGGGGGSGNAGLQLPSVLDPSQQLGGHGLIQELCLKREQQQQQLELAGAGSPAMFGSARLDQEFIGSSTPESSAQLAGLSFGSFSSSATPASAHMSATALLQNAAQMGATLSRPSSQGHMANTHSTSATTNVATTDAATAATSNVTSTAVGADYGLAFESSHFVADVCPERVDALQTGMMVAPAHHREWQKHQQHHHHHHHPQLLSVDFFYRRGPLHGEEHHQLQQHQKQQRTAQESMDEAPICALGGAMFKLPGKLDGLLRQGYMLPKGAENEIPLIKRDLEEIVAILQDHISRSEDPSVMVNCWMKEVRELSYDIEDCIDQYQHAADSKSKYVCRIPRRKFTSRKINRRSEALKQRLWMANKIREFSALVQEALQRHEMYNLGGIGRATTPPPTYVSFFRSPHHIVHGEAADLVGIDAPMNKLEEWLMIKDGEQKLKVVSIVGVGGIGKTTLANELSCKLGDQFDCRAFVRASHKPDMRRLLISMLSQVRPHHPPDTWKVHNLIADIRTHLQDKRYLIIVDDVRATSTWDVVNCALPDDNRSSRILLTTDIEDVAHKCCGYDSKYVFMMKPLGDDDSRKLFFNTVFGPKHECPPELAEVSNSIIRKCGGLPLASVTVASLLARQMGKPEQWDYVNKSLGYGLRTNTTLEGMKLVLNLSYNNLPHHLKACMLYLSIYEHDYVIWKDDLVKQWIAEGFICATEEQDKEEISGSYFDELVSRRMIQPVHINDNDEVLSCIVHHMVLNLITYKSIEENFAIAIDHSQTTTRLADKVHRLSLHFGNAEDATPPTNMGLSQVRTLAFWGVFKCMPSIVEFRLLQVLILHFWGDEESISFDLTRISELFRLRYLQVTCNVTLELRTQMRGLQYLETLKIDARVSAIPSDIVHLPGLLHLNLPAETNLPNGIGHMTSLRTLGYFDLGCNSIENVQSLGELTNLRDLQLTCYNIQPDNLKNMQCLGSILGKLSSLKSITLVPAGSSNVNTLDVAGATSMSISGDGLSSVSSPPFLLQRLELSPRVCIFSSLPKWIGHLCKLCILKIGVRELARTVVDVLRGLPALTVLSLYVHTKPAERIVFDKVGFSVLKYFQFRCSVAWLKFGAGAMPNLRKLKLGFNAHAVDRHSTTIPVGIEHLSGLKEISAKIGGASAEEPDGRSAESALSDAIRMHPGRPNVNIQCVDRMFGGKDDESSGTQEEEHMALQKQYEIMEEDSNEQHGVLQKDSRFSTLSEREILLLLINKLDKRGDDIERTIPVVDVYSVDPWQLPEIGAGEGEPWLYFYPRQEREARGGRPSRTTPSGYWKVAGTPGILYSTDSRPIGLKRTVVFYRGRAPSGTKTKWKMNEYRALEYAGTGATAGARSRADAATLPNPSGQVRSEISLCRLYTKSIMIPRQFGAAGSAGDSPARLLQEEKQYDIMEEDSDEQGGIILKDSGDDTNKHADSRECPQCQIEETTGLWPSLNLDRSTPTPQWQLQGPRPPRQLQGSRPPRLNVSKESQSVKKPRVVPDEAQAVHVARGKGEQGGGAQGEGGAG